MDENEFRFIEDQIGHHFKNRLLLEQAFTRRSYANEAGGADNEVLELIGDAALGLAVLRLLTARCDNQPEAKPGWGSAEAQTPFFCAYDEGELTARKSALVCRETLAQRITELGLAEYLILNESDRQGRVWLKEAVREDLFEAIVGAVTMDCGWDLRVICDVVDIMLSVDSLSPSEQESNYVQKIQDWAERKGLGLPRYHYEDGSYQASWYFPFDGISQQFALNDRSVFQIKHRCLLKISDELPIFRGFGASKSEARKAVCKLAYEELEKRKLLFTIRDEIDEPNLNDAVGQLETLSRRGYCSMPEYRFSETYDRNGNPIWSCSASLPELYRTFDASAASKKGAKKHAAFRLLRYVLDERTRRV